MHPLHPAYPDHLAEPGVVPIGLPVNVGEVDDPAARALLSGFESLGEDCEFGLVQRRYAAEMLGLFRWATLPVGTLMAMLDAGLDGYGEAAQTEIRPAPWGELMAYDLRYDTKMHTFTHRSGVDVEQFKHRHCRRMAFLRTKLLDDLAAGEKVFVCQAGADMTDELACALAASLRRFGPVRLLAVGLAGVVPAGTVRHIGEGVVRGAISRRGKAAVPGGHRWDIDFAGWLALCQACRGLLT